MYDVGVTSSSTTFMRKDT